MKKLIRKLIKIEGYDISYLEFGESGKGEDIIISHGSFCNANVMLEYGLQFAKDNHVILIDLPAHYVSHEQKIDEFDTLLDVVCKTINKFKELNIITKKPILHGWSLGGSLVLGVASKEPTLLKEGVVLNGDCKWVNEAILPFESPEHLIGGYSMIINGASDGVTKERVEKLCSEIPDVLCQYDIANADLKMDFSLDITDDLHKIEIPISLVFGNKDFLTFMDRQESLKEKIKSSQLFVIEGGMHQVCVEKPELVYSLLMK